MNEPTFQFDELGEWSVLKLDIIEQYGSAYTKAFGGRGQRLRKFYIDGFSGAGVHLVKRTRQQVEGSPARALKIQPPFDRFAYVKSRQRTLFFLEPDDEKQSNGAIVAAVRERLNKVAGFEFVPEPMPMVNRRNAVIYYLFFASPKPVAKNIITAIFKKYRR